MPPASPDMVHYTITGAQDWPMFKEMLAGMRILLGGAWFTTMGLLVYIWRNLLNRIASQRKEDKEGCATCLRARNLEFKYVWDAIDVCCPRSGEAKAAVIAAKARIASGGTLPLESAP